MYPLPIDTAILSTEHIFPPLYQFMTQKFQILFTKKNTEFFDILRIGIGDSENEQSYIQKCKIRFVEHPSLHLWIDS